MNAVSEQKLLVLLEMIINDDIRLNFFIHNFKLKCKRLDLG